MNYHREYKVKDRLVNYHREYKVKDRLVNYHREYKVKDRLVNYHRVYKAKDRLVNYHREYKVKDRLVNYHREYKVKDRLVNYHREYKVKGRLVNYHRVYKAKDRLVNYHREYKVKDRLVNYHREYKVKAQVTSLVFSQSLLNNENEQNLRQPPQWWSWQPAIQRRSLWDHTRQRRECEAWLVLSPENCVFHPALKWTHSLTHLIVQIHCATFILYIDLLSASLLLIVFVIVHGRLFLDKSNVF